MKTFFITAGSGQDGVYLFEFVFDKGNNVRGIKCRTSLFNADLIGHLLQDLCENNLKMMNVLRRLGGFGS